MFSFRAIKKIKFKIIYFTFSFLKLLQMLFKNFILLYKKYYIQLLMYYFPFLIY